MKKKMILSLLLAGCCLLAGCSTTASDEEVFGYMGPVNVDPPVQETVPDGEAEPSESAPEDSAKPSAEADPSEAVTANGEDAGPSGDVTPGQSAGPEAANSASPSAAGNESQPVTSAAPVQSSAAPAKNSAAPAQSAAPVRSNPPAQSTPPVQSTAPARSNPPQNSAAPASQPVYVEQVQMSENVNLADEVIPLATSPAAVPVVLSPVASGTAVQSGGGATIDYSNIKDGYVMARFPESSEKRIRVQVKGPTTTYTYDLPTGSWVTFPLSDGNGSYQVTVLQNTTGKKYAVLASASFQAAMTDEFAPFLRPNQYVNYEGATNTIAKAAQLTSGISEPLKKVAAVYDFVVKNLTYDYQRAAAVSSGQLNGYLPKLDSVLAERKGICFDYAALMTGMLRSQGVPCKLVVGYAGTTYHAWVSVWTAETGWVDGVIYFDGTTWQRMDPTFASSGNTQFTLNANNYKVKYLY